MSAEKDLNADVAKMSYEQARDELVKVVAELEQGSVSLEASLALWGPIRLRSGLQQSGWLPVTSAWCLAAPQRPPTASWLRWETCRLRWQVLWPKCGHRPLPLKQAHRKSPQVTPTLH